MPSGPTPPDVPPRAPTPPSETSAALPPTYRISTRTRRRTAAAAGAAQPAVDYGSGPGRVPQTSSSRIYPPPRVPLLRLPLSAAPSASRAPTPVPTVPIPSDRDRAEPLGVPLLGFSTPSESPSAHTADLDVLGAATELHLCDSAARYSHADWEREQRAEPTRYAAISYILPGRLLALPIETFARFLSHQRPPFSEIHELLGKGRLHTTDEGIALLVRNPTPARYSLRPAGRAACLLEDEPIRINVPLLMHPWIMQACYSTVSCHLGTARTLRMFECFCWWIEMSICTRWRWRHRFKCQARKTPRITVRGPSFRFSSLRDRALR